MTIIEVASNAAQKAGKVLSEHYLQPVRTEAKGAHDLVSEVDLASEKVIIETIQATFPDHNIISEEEGAISKNSEYTWIIDPLDGTSNFIGGVPYFAVSIGVLKNNEVIAGVVLNPVMKELFHAEKGQGAFLNNKAIHVSDRKELSEAYLATAYSAEEDDIIAGTKAAATLALNSRRTLLNFAPAPDLCNIACGRLDGLIDNGSTPEDHAGASIILSEAGGTLRNLHHEGWNVRETGIIASNGIIQGQLVQLLMKNKHI